MENIVEDLRAFIKNSPTSFHAIQSIEEELKQHDFMPLLEGQKWVVKRGGKYYVIRNHSSIIAFAIGENVETDYSFQICASHSDSPTFKIKEHTSVEVNGKYTQLNVEGYGGMIASTWMDRPLSIAGRVLLKTNEGFVTRLLDFARDMALIPNVAIHMNRGINAGYKYNMAVDMLPLYGDKDGDFDKELAKELNVKEENIVGHDLFLYNRTPSSVWGNKEAYLSAPRLDDLECAYTTLQGFLNKGNTKTVQVYACFDNEEVGSTTRQGANSTLLNDVLSRINYALGYDEEQLCCAYAHSFMLSADNAHALHPNHPEKSDAYHGVYMNEGVVVKFNANQKYTSDALSKGLFQSICEEAKVPLQAYANRSDMVGGSTLGNISSSHVSIYAVDIGLAQLAMHSSYETVGTRDIAYMIQAVTAFYGLRLMEDDTHLLHLER